LLRRVIRWLAANSFGLFFALLVFMALPFLQIVANSGSKKMEVRQVAVVEAPPAPEIEEEQPPEEPPEPEEQPEMEPNDQPLSLDSLDSLLNPGASDGGGAQIFSEALAKAVSDQAGNMMTSLGAEQQPRCVYQPSPKYPAALVKKGISGVVKVELIVDANGRVTNPRVVSSPHPDLKDAALAAVKQWRYEPGTRDGSTCPFKIRVPISFGSA
jgi:protein TonB